MSVSEVPISLQSQSAQSCEDRLTCDPSRRGITARLRSHIATAELAAVRGWFVWSVSLTIVAVGALMLVAEPSVPRWDSPVPLY
jgi:hypothetical protein